MDPLTFVPKIFLPKKVLIGKRAIPFFTTLQKEKRLILLSKKFFEKNRILTRKIFGENSTLILLDGEPDEKTIKKLKDKIVKKSFNYLIAIGGGSVIDSAKIINQTLKKVFIAIPTTIGSGAEVSPYAVFLSNRMKKVLYSPDFIPETVIISKIFVSTIPKKEVIYQSIDALSHGLESLVSRMSNKISDYFALCAIDGIYEILNKIAAGENYKNFLEDLQVLSLMAGVAQGSVGTGIAHSFAHVLGPKNSMPHSRAVTNFLIVSLKLNSQYDKFYEKINSSKNLTSKNFITKLEKNFENLGIKRQKLRNFDLENDPILIRKDQTMLSNPFIPEENKIRKILEKFI